MYGCESWAVTDVRRVRALNEEVDVTRPKRGLFVVWGV